MIGHRSPRSSVLVGGGAVLHCPDDLLCKRGTRRDRLRRFAVDLCPSTIQADFEGVELQSERRQRPSEVNQFFGSLVVPGIHGGGLVRSHARIITCFLVQQKGRLSWRPLSFDASCPARRSLLSAV